MQFEFSKVSSSIQFSGKITLLPDPKCISTDSAREQNNFRFRLSKAIKNYSTPKVLSSMVLPTWCVHISYHVAPSLHTSRYHDSGAHRITSRCAVETRLRVRPGIVYMARLGVS
jgi:hypothetical protein